MIALELSAADALRLKGLGVSADPTNEQIADAIIDRLPILEPDRPTKLANEGNFEAAYREMCVRLTWANAMYHEAHDDAIDAREALDTQYSATLVAVVVAVLFAALYGLKLYGR